MSSTFDLIIKHKIKTLEEETILGLYNIILRMHKHAVEDYINVISCYYNEDLEEAKSEVEFEKIFKKNFFEMFVHIEEDLQYRVKKLKLELMKRFDIEPNAEELLSDSESDSENYSESDDKKIKNKNLTPTLGNINELIPTADKSKSDSEIEIPIIKMTKDGKLEFNGKWINKIEDINEIKSKHNIDIIKLIHENFWFFGIPIGMENFINKSEEK